VRDPRHVDGDVAEAIAVKELLSQGFYVFRNIQTSSPIDLVAVSPGGEIYLLDVKKIGYRKKEGWGPVINRARTQEQKFLDVWFCYVDLEKQTIEIREPGVHARPQGSA